MRLPRALEPAGASSQRPLRTAPAAHAWGAPCLPPGRRHQPTLSGATVSPTKKMYELFKRLSLGNLPTMRATFTDFKGERTGSKPALFAKDPEWCDHFRSWNTTSADKEEIKEAHAMVIVGYGTFEGEDYYEVQNSWGATEMLGGTMRIAMDYVKKGDAEGEFYVTTSLPKSWTPAGYKFEQVTKPENDKMCLDGVLAGGAGTCDIACCEQKCLDDDACTHFTWFSDNGCRLSLKGKTGFGKNGKDGVTHDGCKSKTNGYKSSWAALKATIFKKK